MQCPVHEAATKIRSNRLEIIGYYARYGNNAFMGRNIETDIFELVAGRFYDDPLTSDYMTA